MGSKRVGHARIAALINKNMNELSFPGNSGLEAGSGINHTDGDGSPVYASWVERFGDVIKTSVYVDCVETPAGGEPDIDLYSAEESTGTENALVTGLTETKLLDAAGDWTATTAPKHLTALPAADEYLYLAISGDAGDLLEYSAGKFIIEFWGKAV